MTAFLLLKSAKSQADITASTIPAKKTVRSFELPLIFKTSERKATVMYSKTEKLRKTGVKMNPALFLYNRRIPVIKIPGRNTDKSSTWTGFVNKPVSVTAGGVALCMLAAIISLSHSILNSIEMTVK